MSQLNSVEIILFEEIGKILPNTFGYIDKNGNFYSLGMAKLDNYGLFMKDSTSGIGIVAKNILNYWLTSEVNLDSKIELTWNIPLSEEEYNYHFASQWPANALLEKLGFCRFFRCYYDYDDPYEDDSFFIGASSKQLFVMNYLFALNCNSSYNIEKRRLELMRLYMKEFEEGLKRTLEK